ncbi:sorbosone dehydrogenase [Blastopirellula marina]|uniref:Sorbosone dehydrogenase n=1 Tax=Blastopirellula marina TaxID=124 RepID=A0A2S8FU64_9BACT|nr:MULTISPECIES: PVC-type heme-binding CxxCH protein [Pirellulaceae]PQO35719.1 sorbosone dehydrogenase [Blastopirellula marina]RCS53293.1 sorbosone dehydrogenase [Bremerella cremea]
MNRPAITLLLLLIAPAVLFAQRDLKVIPDTDPAAEQRSFTVAEGFEVNLFASEPMIASPIQINFDAQGRLWVASSSVYPQIEPGQVADDKILMLEDTDGDGAADKSTVFADGLLIPTGVLPGDGGVYVANSTELLHMKDTDGDGKADQKRVVLSGFGTEDTHHILHTLRWGYDGMMYFNQSIYIHSHIETPHGVRRLNAGGIWQFRPETMELDVFCRGFVNTWGHHFNDYGANFATDGAYGEGINYTFPGAVFVTAADSRRLLQGLNPGSPKHCGLELVGGSHLPEDWQTSAITNDFRAHRVCRFVLEEDGSGYASRQAEDVIKASHGAFRPVDVKMGPDGAIYIADWYNPIIQHGEVDFRDPRRDHVHGRIWRVTKKGSPLVKPQNLHEASIEELLAALKSPEKWVRTQAKQQLKQRSRTDVLQQLAAWMQGLAKDDPATEHQRLEGLWAYQALDETNETLLLEMLASPNHNIRAAAVRVASQWHDEVSDPLGLFTAAVRDEHPRVRLEGVRALATIPSSQAMIVGLEATRQPMDRFLDFAVWQLVEDLAPVWIPDLKEAVANNDKNSKILQDAKAHPASWAFAFEAIPNAEVAEAAILLLPDADAETSGRLVELAAQRGGSQLLGNLLNSILPGGSRAGDNSQIVPILKSFLVAMQVRKTKPEGDLAAIEKLYASDSPEVAALAFDTAIAWNVASQDLVRAYASGEKELPAAARVAAVRALAKMPGQPTSKLLVDLIQSDAADQAVRLAALESLATFALPNAANQTAVLLAKEGNAIPADALLAPFVSRKQGQIRLAEALKDKKLPRDQAQLALRSARSSSQASPELVAAIQAAGGLTEGVRQWSDDELAEITRLVMESGDPHAGEAIFRKEALNCFKCHAIGEAGGNVGPNLISLGASAQPDYIVESILRPSAKVKENFHSLIILTDEGKVLTGIPVRENKDLLVLRDAEGREIEIPQEAIDDRAEGRSLMPDGSIDALTTKEIVDLAAFMSKLGKAEEFSIGSQKYLRSWKTLTYNDESNRAINRSSNNTVAAGNAAFVWKPVFSQVDGGVPLAELPVYHPHRNQPQFAYLQTDIGVASSGTFRFAFEGPEGLSVWLDGKPIPTAKELEADWKPGVHQLTLAINLDERKESVKVRLLEDQSTGRLATAAKK